MRKIEFSARVMEAYAAASLPAGLEVRAASATDAPAEMLFYGVVGDDLTDVAFVKALATVPEGPMTLRVNSPGGCVFTGYAILNAIQQRGGVTVQIDGIAASAAAFIAMGAERVVMAETSQVMLHCCWGLAVGNRHDLLEQAAVMEKIDGQQAALFARKTGKDAAEISAMLDAETWLTSTEALAMGFADEVLAPPAKPAKKSAEAAIAIVAEAPAAEAPAIVAEVQPEDTAEADAFALQIATRQRKLALAKAG